MLVADAVQIRWKLIWLTEDFLSELIIHLLYQNLVFIKYITHAIHMTVQDTKTDSNEL